MPSPYDYASGTGYSRARSDWADFPSTTTPIQQTHLDKIEQAVYDLKFEKFNVKDFQAVGDGSNDDTAEIQAAIDACSTAGGGVVWFPRGTYKISATLTVPSFVALVGVGNPYRATEYSIDPSGKASIITHTAAAFTMIANSDSTNGNVGITIKGLRLDQTNESGDNFIVDFNKVRRSAVYDCYLKGQATASRIGIRHRGISEHNSIVLTTLEGCGIKSDGSANRLAIDTCEISSAGIWLETGFDHVVHNCDLYLSGVSAPYPWDNLITLASTTGAMVYGNQLVDALNDGIGCTRAVKRSHIICNHIKNSSRESAGVWAGIALDSDSAASPTEHNVVTGNVCWDSAGAGGTQSEGIRILSASGAQTNNNVVVGNVFTGNKDTTVLQTSGLVNLIHSNGGPETGSVASAATITIPPGARVVAVSGTTNITSVTAGYPGQVVTLIFAGALTFTNGSNLNLAGNFTTSADDSISLVYDGTNWTETGRVTVT